MALSGASTLSITQGVIVPYPPITMALWVWFPTSVTAGGTNYIFTLGTSGSFPNEQMSMHYTGTGQAGVSPYGFGVNFGLQNWAAPGLYDLSGSTGLSNGVWHHICFVMTSSVAGTADSASIYYDGVLNVTANNPGGTHAWTGFFNNPATTTASLYTGTVTGIATIAAPAVWNIALTGSQIATLAAGANPQSVAHSNLISYVKLDTSSGTIPDAVSGTWTINGGSFTVSADPPLSGGGSVWASNGQQTGGSGSYVAGTQSVGYILANFANDGDTITLPAGTFDWGNSTTAVTTTITKAITLQGVNPGSPGNTAPESAFTTIVRNNNGHTSTGNMLACVAPTTGHITIEYICFKQNVDNSSQFGSTTVPAIDLDRSDVSGGSLVTTPYTCLFHDCFVDSTTFAVPMMHLSCNGIVIWQCTFTVQQTANQICGINATPTKYGDTLLYNNPDTMGSGATTYGVGDTSSGYAGVAGLNNSYIETCSFYNGAGTCLNCDSNARAVIRDCYLQDSNIQIHGSTSAEAVRHVEIYDNIFRNINASSLNVNSWMTIRSGALLITGNTIDNVVSKSPIEYFLEGVNRGNFQSAGQIVYPASRQIGYGWSSANNTGSTSQTGTLNSTNKVTGLNTSTLVRGQKVSGTSIQAGTLIQFIDSPTSIILTLPATGSGSSSLTFTGIPYGTPPVLGPSIFGAPSGGKNFGYGQQRNPCYCWSNTGTGTPTAANTFIAPYSSDGFGNNLTAAGYIRFNQQVSAFSAASTSSLSATLPGTQNGSVQYPGSWLNDLLLCMVSWTTSGTPTVTVTDTANTGGSGAGNVQTIIPTGSLAPITGNLNGTTTVAGIDTSKIAIGMAVSGTNIAGGATVSDILSDTSFLLSSPATGSGVGVVLTFSGNIWTQIGSTFNATTGVSQAIFATINKSQTAAFPVTVNFSTPVSNLAMNIADYAGNWAAVNQLRSVVTDGSSQNASSSSTTMSPGSITTTNNSGGNDLIIVWAKTGATPTGVTGGFTQQSFDGTNHFGFFDNIGTGASAGPLSTTGTFALSATTTAPWTASTVAFQSQPFLLNGRDYLFSATPSGWTRFTYPHPLTNSGSGTIAVSGNITVTGSVNPTLNAVSSAGNGLTAASDSSIIRLIVGATGGYTPPTNNYWALYSTWFTAQAKAGATEWSASSDTAYVRVPIGASGIGWSIAAYSSGIGVVWSNLNVLTQPGVQGTAQTLASLGFCDALAIGTGNIDFFVDANNPMTVPIGISVILAVGGVSFTTY